MAIYCPRCLREHEIVFLTYADFLNPEKITYEKCIEFLKTAKAEISNNRFNELFCLTSTVVSQISYLKSSNKFSNLFWQECLILNEIISKNPLNSQIEFLEKLIYTYSDKQNKKNMPFRIKQDINKEDLINEYHKIIDVIEKTKENPKILVPLLNYSLLRMVSFYERWVHDTLVKEIDQLSRDSLYLILDKDVKIHRDDIIHSRTLSVGKIGVLNLDNSPSSLNFLIIKLLQAKYHNQTFLQNGKTKFIKINDHFRFFDLFNQCITITDEQMKKVFDEFGNWFKMIQNVNFQRNSMTHELGNVEYPREGIELIFGMYYIFIRVFPHLLKLILNFKITNMTESHKQSEYEMLKDLSNIYSVKLYSVKPYSDVANLIETTVFTKSPSDK